MMKKRKPERKGETVQVKLIVDVISTKQIEAGVSP